eukprot:CAMPEP_0185731104 /NCGR_PEP_ID=MMETSP1171-20130828/11892_1 /TAXON_ID=374046 /ORGANISM="Helicotheca tamensis, Strain CCMP826" /LENGTH=612 /DNA_ID=CAMNT_0028400293 /DNA_START=57 /DNA_END=1895 /DNA_ORIENTATION=-
MAMASIGDRRAYQIILLLLLINNLVATYALLPPIRCDHRFRTTCQKTSVVRRPTSELSSHKSKASLNKDIIDNQLRRHHRSSHKKVSPLRNIPLEDALEIELNEMEEELHLKTPKKDNIIAPSSKEQTQKQQDQQQRPKQIKITDAASIIAGTAIGGGFLALPSVTSPIGYIPSVLGITMSWGFLLLCSFAFIEAAGLVADLKKLRANDANEKGIDEAATTSIATVVKYAFGPKYALVGSFLFIAEMLAVMTIQIVKGAELFSDCFRVPYLLGCLLPTTLAGLFSFQSKPEVVERANTVLTFMMVGGFIALIIGTILSGNVGKMVGGTLFSRADYSKLLPTIGSDAWALPVFVKIICFGQAMPLVVERMMQGVRSQSMKSDDLEGHKVTNKINGDATEDIETAVDAAKKSSLFRARTAATLGATVPIILSLAWAAISTALVSPTVSNPLKFLLSMGPSISIPVGLLATGAIGTTLLGCFLAMRHFMIDMICSICGHCSVNGMNIANALTVAIPSILACAGPALYLPLMVFCGAYPTTILHGLSPALAALVLRRRVRQEAQIKDDGAVGMVRTPRIVPGGDVTMITLVSAALGLIGASSYFALRNLASVVVGA